MIKLPDDFDWQFYLNKYEDLRKSGLSTKKHAEEHYLKYGHLEKRLYSDRLNFIITSNKNRKFNKIDGVNLFGFGNSVLGIGHLMRVIKQSIDCTNISHSINVINLSQTSTLEYFESNTDPIYNTNLFLMNPDESILELNSSLIGRYNIGLWSWELEKMPKKWLELSDLFDELWTISSFCEKVMKKEMPDKIIKYLNIPAEYKSKRDKKFCKKELGLNDKFVVLFTFDGNSDINRKNPMDLITTFSNSIGKKDNTYLIIKSHNLTENELIKYFFNLPPNVKVINECWDKEKMSELFNSADIYVSLHRAEGLGMTIMESIELEIPVICTKYSGNLDFCDENCVLVDYELVDIETDNSNYKDFKGFCKWAQIDFEDVENKMIEIYENYDYYKSKIQLTKNKMLQKYNIYQLSKFLEKNLNNE